MPFVRDRHVAITRNRNLIAGMRAMATILETQTQPYLLDQEVQVEARQLLRGDDGDRNRFSFSKITSQVFTRLRGCRRCSGQCERLR